MKFLDWCVNSVAVHFDRRVHSPWLTYSFLVALVCRRRRLRADYIEFTARRYARGCRESYRNGYVPEDWRTLKEDYWREQLRLEFR